VGLVVVYLTALQGPERQCTAAAQGLDAKTMGLGHFTPEVIQFTAVVEVVVGWDQTQVLMDQPVVGHLLQLHYPGQGALVEFIQRLRLPQRRHYLVMAVAAGIFPQESEAVQGQRVGLLAAVAAVLLVLILLLTLERAVLVAAAIA
jgi:hypothetical protein